MCVACFLGAAEGLPAAVPGPFPPAPAPFPLADGGAPGVTVTWTGVAGFVLEHGGTRIAFDPFVSRPGLLATLFRAPRVDHEAARARFASLEAVFLGHAHFDHAMDVAAVADASPRARVVGGPTATALAGRLGVADARLARAEDGARFTVGPFTVEAVAAAHGVVPVARWVDRLRLPAQGLPATPFRYPRGEVLAWRVEVGGRAIHLHGSAGLDERALARQEPVDVLVACLAARAGTPRYLARLGERLRPRVLVPCHHDDFFRPLAEAPRPVRTLRWARFLAEAAELERDHGTRLWLPPRDVACAW